MNTPNLEWKEFSKETPDFKKPMLIETGNDSISFRVEINSTEPSDGYKKSTAAHYRRWAYINLPATPKAQAWKAYKESQGGDTGNSEFAFLAGYRAGECSK